MDSDFEPQKHGPKKIHLLQGYKTPQPHTRVIHIGSLFLQVKAAIIQRFSACVRSKSNRGSTITNTQHSYNLVEKRIVSSLQ